MDHSHDGSSDPPNQSSMHWSQERLSADVNRAVGGNLNLIREISRLSHELDPEMPTDWMIKRTQFFAYELASILPEGLDERERLSFLNGFFFDRKCFKCLTDSASLSRPSDAFRMSRVLAARAGSPMVLALIYAFLAERIEVRLEFVDLKSAWFLCWKDGARSRYIDITRGGAMLSSDELIAVMQSRCSEGQDNAASSLLETLTFEKFLVAYITDLKRALSGYDLDPAKLLFLQNALIVYQPSNLLLLGDRAILHRKLGNFKSALSDLKRFFAFHDRERAPGELVRLHDELVTLLNRQSKTPPPPLNP